MSTVNINNGKIDIMKLLFRGYNPLPGNSSRHLCLANDFRCFEQDFVKDVNLTYSYSVLVTDHCVFFANFCEHHPEGWKSKILNAGKGVFQASGCNNKVVLLNERGELFKVVCLNNNQVIDYELQPVAKFVHAEGDKIVKIACGAKINVALTEQGKLFRFPDEIDVGKIKIKDIAAGREHCVVLDESGAVFTFGAGSRGQLGHGTLEMEEEPTLVKALDGIKISAIAAGGWHSCAISEQGDLYTWGWNCNGQLGIGDQYSVMATPHVVDFDGNEQANVVKVACGTRHTLALLDSKKLYGCGWNKYKQICNEEVENTFNFVVSYDLSEFSVENLVCGPWSSVVICK